MIVSNEFSVPKVGENRLRMATGSLYVEMAPNVEPQISANGEEGTMYEEITA